MHRNHRRLILLLAVFVAGMPTSAQELSLDVDTIYSVYEDPHRGQISEVLGYDVYVLVPNEGDQVMAIFGDQGSPMFIRSEQGFRTNGSGNVFEEDSGKADSLHSFLTIEGSAKENGPLHNLKSPDQDWISSFREGGNIEASDAVGGVWFTLPGSRRGVAGSDRRVLVARLMTPGRIAVRLNVQWRTADGKTTRISYALMAGGIQ